MKTLFLKGYIKTYKAYFKEKFENLFIFLYNNNYIKMRNTK
jgi:hypothetical protein